MRSGLTRRRFLALSGAAPALAACGSDKASPAVPSPPAGVTPVVTFRQDFNSATVGVYHETG